MGRKQISRNKNKDDKTIRSISKGKVFKHGHTATVRERSSKSFDPFEQRRKREFYRNSKNVRKYKKLVQDLDQDGDDNQTLEARSPAQFHSFENEPDEQFKEDEDEEVPDGKLNRKVGAGSYPKHEKKKSTLQKLREEYEKQQQEKEKIRKEKEIALAAKRAAQEEAARKRKDMKSKMSKRTRSGQPVMKFRVEQMLEKIQKSNQ